MQWALAYLAGAWLVIQLVDVLGSRWGVGVYWARVIDLLLVSGLLITLIAWFFDREGASGGLLVASQYGLGLAIGGSACQS